MDRVWLLSSNVIRLDTRDCELRQTHAIGHYTALQTTTVNKQVRVSLAVPSALLHVGSDLVHVDLRVQESGEMGRTHLGGSSHLQVIQIQPEIRVTHRPIFITLKKYKMLQFKSQLLHFTM